MTRAAVVLALWIFGTALEAAAQRSDRVDIGGNGAPVLSGDLGGSIAGSPGPFADLQVTINFGEVSPLNPSRIVTAVVPVGVRSESDYRVIMTVSNFTNNGDPEGIQLSDIGFGLQNLAPSGGGARNCRTTSSVIAAPFNNNPAATVNLADRASYPSSLANIASQTVILSGPELSKGKVKPRKPNNGWSFDAIFTIVPQFYSAGTASVTVTFTIIDELTNTKCK